MPPPPSLAGSSASQSTQEMRDETRKRAGLSSQRSRDVVSASKAPSKPAQAGSALQQVQQDGLDNSSKAATSSYSHEEDEKKGKGGNGAGPSWAASLVETGSKVSKESRKGEREKLKRALNHAIPGWEEGGKLQYQMRMKARARSAAQVDDEGRALEPGAGPSNDADDHHSNTIGRIRKKTKRSRKSKVLPADPDWLKKARGG